MPVWTASSGTRQNNPGKIHFCFYSECFYHFHPAHVETLYIAIIKVDLWQMN
jgi:hypothetical protein